MRIWQKIYIVTLILFLLMLNAGLFLTAGFFFTYTIEQEKKKAETDCYFLCQNLEHDFSVLKQNGRYQESIAQLLLEGYQAHYRTQGVALSLKETEREEAPYLRCDISGGGKKAEIFVERNLNGPYEAYRIQYRKRLTDFEGVWSMLKKMFGAVSLAASVLLCLMLYALMRRMLRPLGKLNADVAKIADGEYELKTGVKSRAFWQSDEIMELSCSVGKLSETIQKQIGALKEENEKKQRLMDNMAHELKTPLTSIYGYAEYLRYARASEEEKRDGLTYIMEESKRLSKMSETMLSMRLYEKEERPAEAIDLHAATDHLEKILAVPMREKRLTIQREFEMDTAYGEKELFINLFRNLLENAICASHANGVIIFSARMWQKEQTFAVIDFGAGMEEAELERITEAFYRVDKARSRNDGGVGLGLSVADLIVKKMHGRMEFFSSPGKGTKVLLFLQLPDNCVKG